MGERRACKAFKITFALKQRG